MLQSCLVRDDVRVIRSCGWIEHKNECYTTVLEEYNTYVCTCKEVINYVI